MGTIKIRHSLQLPIVKGADGYTPYIGENGNWYINGEDTGVLTQGTDGEDATINGLNAAMIAGGTDISVTQNSSTIIISLAETAKKRLFIDLWNAACKRGNTVLGKFNDNTGFFELNGLTDITYEQAVYIYTRGKAPLSAIDNFFSAIPNPLFRTNLPSGMGVSVVMYNYTFVNCSFLEVADAYYMGGGNSTFLSCTALREIKNMYGMVSNSTNTFKGCVSLESINMKIYSNVTAVSFSDSPLLSYESVSYLANNAAPKNTCIVTVHEDVYNKLTGMATDQDYINSGHSKSEWMAIVDIFSKRNVSFAID